MLVGVHKPGENPTALEIHRLIIGTGGQVGLGAHQVMRPFSTVIASAWRFSRSEVKIFPLI